MQRLLSLQKQLINAPQIDAQEFKVTVFGPNYPQRDRGFEILRNNDMLHHYHLTEASKEQIRYRTLVNVIKSKKKYGKSVEEADADPNSASIYSNSLVYYDLGFSVRSGVHFFLYLKAIKLLGTEKHQELLRRAFYLKDIGCFGLTELTHGSNVKGILTQAHYDDQNKEFVMHSPSKEAMKFWIGGAAHTANMAVIWAQLYIDGKCYGVHAYVVPIRDPQTHKLLPGVLIGDCGPKIGLNGIDNGFILLDKVRIPKMNQLDRISGVDENGKFRTIIQSDDKRFGLHLSALSGGRYMISTNCCAIATQAVTIGIRYTTERRQFKIGNNKQETLLFDYPLTKRRMMPLLAQNLVYTVAAIRYVTEWDANQKNILEPSHPMIEKLHAISSVMKAKTSWFATQCVRECREMLGGNGFSSYSKLGTLYNDNDVNLTWEGDNHVLIQQTTKYVLEEVQKVLQKGKKTNNELLKFVDNPPDDLIPFTRDSLKCPHEGLKFLQFKLLRKIEETGLNMVELKQKGLPVMDIWNNSQVFLGRDVALTYGDISILTTMIQAIKQCKNPTNKHIFETATRLWMLSVYRKDEFVEIKHHPLLESLISEQAHLLAVHSLEILKVISIDDEIIGSPFADPNGHGIEKYLKLVMSKPTNQRPEWWETLITR